MPLPERQFGSEFLNSPPGRIKLFGEYFQTARDFQFPQIGSPDMPQAMSEFTELFFDYIQNCGYFEPAAVSDYHNYWIYNAMYDPVLQDASFRILEHAGLNNQDVTKTFFCLCLRRSGIILPEVEEMMYRFASGMGKGTFDNQDHAESFIWKIADNSTERSGKNELLFYRDRLYGKEPDKLDLFDLYYDSPRGRQLRLFDFIDFLCNDSGTISGTLPRNPLIPETFAIERVSGEYKDFIFGIKNGGLPFIRHDFEKYTSGV